VHQNSPQLAHLRVLTPIGSANKRPSLPLVPVGDAGVDRAVAAAPP